MRRIAQSTKGSNPTKGKFKKGSFPHKALAEKTPLSYDVNSKLLQAHY